jgi:hypothetical protein
MNNRNSFIALLAGLFAASPAGAYTMADIIARLSENSNKIESYSARADIRYHI